MAELEHRYVEYGGDYKQIVKYAVVYKDVFSLKYLYMLMHEWLIENGYCTRDDSSFGETFYLQRNTPAGRNLLIRWRLTKDIGSKIFHFDLDIDFLVLTLKETEIIHKGKKFKADNGEVEVSVRANLVVKKEFFENPLLKHFKKLILQQLFRKRADQLEEQIYGEAYKLRTAITNYLNIQNFFPEAETAEFFETAKPE